MDFKITKANNMYPMVGYAILINTMENNLSEMDNILIQTVIASVHFFSNSGKRESW